VYEIEKQTQTEGAQGCNGKRKTHD
jgi:hypothetical protein